MCSNLLKSGCGKLPSYLQKDANKPPIQHNRLAKRHATRPPK